MTISAARPSPPMAPAPEGSTMRAAPRPGPLAGVTWRSGPIDPWINPRVRIAGLWAAMLFAFAYVDLFSLYRADVRAELEFGRVGGFGVGEGFLLATTGYVLVPVLALAGSLVLPARATRALNLVVPVVLAGTIVASAVGEMGYVVLGSGVEVLLLGGISWLAWTWPMRVPAVPRADAWAR